MFIGDMFIGDKGFRVKGWKGRPFLCYRAGLRYGLPRGGVRPLPVPPPPCTSFVSNTPTDFETLPPLDLPLFGGGWPGGPPRTSPAKTRPSRNVTIAPPTPSPGSVHENRSKTSEFQRFHDPISMRSRELRVACSAPWLEAEGAEVSGADFSGRPSCFRAVTLGGNRGQFPPLNRSEVIKTKENQRLF